MSRFNIFGAVVALLFVGQFWLASVIPTQAQGNCNTHDSAREQLADRFGERVIVMGLSASGALMELWANPDTGTWTLTATNAAGLTCVIGSGEAFDLAPATPDDEDA
jgi:hypothetical protein